MSIKCPINDQCEAQTSRRGLKLPSSHLEEVFGETSFVFEPVVFGGAKEGDLGSETEES